MLYVQILAKGDNMRNLAILTIAAVGLTATPAIANSVTLGEVEEVKVRLDQTKFDTSIPAEQRFEKLKRVAERKCNSFDRSLKARNFEEACALELKRSILAQVGDEALKAEAKRQGVPL